MVVYAEGKFAGSFWLNKRRDGWEAYAAGVYADCFENTNWKYDAVDRNTVAEFIRIVALRYDEAAVDIVHYDHDRTSTRRARELSKDGSTHFNSDGKQVHPSSNQFRKEAAEALKVRFAKYIASTNPNVADVHELMQLIRSSRFLDTITVSGYVYELNRGSIDITPLLGRHPERSTFRYELFPPRKNLNSDEAIKVVIEDPWSFPRMFEVELAFEGGAIIPVKITPYYGHGRENPGAPAVP